MIRKAIIVALTVCGLSTGVAAILSLRTPPPLRLLVRGWGIEIADEQLSVHYTYKIGLRYADPMGSWSRTGLYEYQRVWTRSPGSRRTTVAAQLTVSAWLVAAVCVAYPILAFIRGPLRDELERSGVIHAPRVPEHQMGSRQLAVKCVVRLGIWLVILSLLGVHFAPALRVRFPRLIDILILCLIPVGAFDAARYRGPFVAYLLYGCMASWWPTVTYLSASEQRRRGPIRQSDIEWWIDVWLVIAMACLVAIGPGLLSRFVARFRQRRVQRYPSDQCQECGYDLTGNVSGVCPECGSPVRPSTAAWFLRFATPGWVQQLARGVLLLIIAFGVFAVGRVFILTPMQGLLPFTAPTGVRSPSFRLLLIRS